MSNFEELRRNQRSDGDPRRVAMARIRMGLPVVGEEIPKKLFKAKSRKTRPDSFDQFRTRKNRNAQRLRRHRNGVCQKDPNKCRFCRRYGVN